MSVDRGKSKFEARLRPNRMTGVNVNRKILEGRESRVMTESRDSRLESKSREQGRSEGFSFLGEEV